MYKNFFLEKNWLSKFKSKKTTKNHIIEYLQITILRLIEILIYEVYIRIET